MHQSGYLRPPRSPVRQAVNDELARQPANSQREVTVSALMNTFRGRGLDNSGSLSHDRAWFPPQRFVVVADGLVDDLIAALASAPTKTSSTAPQIEPSSSRSLSPR